MSLRRLVLACVFFSALVGAAPAQAQYFRNNGIAVLTGWKGLGSTWDGATGQKIWNMSDQGTIGMGYFTALGYNLFFDILQAEIGMGAERLVTGRAPGPIFSFSATSGVRYNFLEEGIRPFVSGHVQYLQIIPVTPDPEIPTNALTGNAPFWVGARVGGGCEFFIMDEVSLLAHLGMTVFTGLNSPPPGATPGITNFLLPQANGGLTAHIYF
jgi:hypothetical protein